MRLSLLTPLLCLSAYLAIPAAAETLKGCRALTDGAQRLACYDALGPAEAVDAETLLVNLLGDPKAIGKEYELLGNSRAVLQMLPGRWLVTSWGRSARSLLDGDDDLERTCASNAAEIVPSATDPYTLSLNVASAKGGPLHIRDILLSTRWRLADVMKVQGIFALYGIEPGSEVKLDKAGQLFADAVSLAVYLPITPDVVMAVNSAKGEIGLMLRCPSS